MGQGVKINALLLIHMETYKPTMTYRMPNLNKAIFLVLLFAYWSTKLGCRCYVAVTSVLRFCLTATLSH